MFTNTLPKNADLVVEKLGKTNFINGFYLSGGTALSLQIGHRESQDLDFFTQIDFKPETLQKELEVLGKLEKVELDKGTLNCFMDSIKLQFLYYPYLLLEPKVKWEGIQLSSKLDIACTKLITVSSRGNKKDFIDIYFLLKEYDLQMLFDKLKKKYPKTDYNETHILKSLVYFTDANKQPLPRMHETVDWKQVKENLISKVKNFQL